MAEFDILGQNSDSTEAQGNNILDSDAFGSGNITNTETVELTAIADDDQLHDFSLTHDDNSIDTIATGFNTSSTDNMYDLDAAPLAQQSTSSDYKQLINQPNTNELDTDFSIIHPPTLDDILNNSAMANEAEDSSSSDIFSNSVPSAAAANTNQLNLTEISSTENLSSLQIFNSRRQEEIAKKDVEEKQKIEELRQKAKDDIERWYQDRRMRMEQKRQTMKRDEDYLRLKALEKSDKDSCDWAKVIRLLEFSQGSQLSKSRRDLNRMKSSMINAKRHKDNQK